MDTNKKLQFIQKLVDKTKDNTLQWKRLSTNIAVFKIPEHMNVSFDGKPLETKTYNYERSYFAPYKDSFFFLVSSKTQVPNSVMYMSSDFNLIELIMQSPVKGVSRFITSTDRAVDKDSTIQTQLVRLYNLVESSSPNELDNIIDDFLNS